MADTSGTIDITSTVQDMQDTFIKWADDFVYAQLTAVTSLASVVAIPIVKFFLGWFINWLITKLAGSTVMIAFFGNTAIRKASQAVDYTTAKAAVKNASPNLSDADYEALEDAEILAFNNFVMVTN